MCRLAQCIQLPPFRVPQMIECAPVVVCQQYLQGRVGMIVLHSSMATGPGTHLTLRLLESKPSAGLDVRHWTQSLWWVVG